MTTESQSLDAMLDGDTTAPAHTPEPVASTGANDSAAPPADASQQPQPRDDGPLVPRRALEDERRKRQEYEQKVREFEARLQPQPQQQAHVEIPDMFADPQGYTNFVFSQAAAYAQHAASAEAERRILNRELNKSERRARKEFGDEAVDAAFEAAIKANVGQRFMDSDDAYADMVKWHKDYQIATNPEAMRAAIEAEILAKHRLAPAQSQQPQRPRAPVPKSLASTASAQPRDDRGRFSGPTPLEDILG